MGMLDLFREWLKKADNRFRPRRRFGLESPEQLETRAMLSAVLIGTTLNVNAEPLPQNNIVINQDSSGVKVTENGVETFSSAMPIDTVNVFGSFGDDNVTVTSLFKPTVFTFDGAGGTNSLTAPSGPNNWLITGVNSGLWNGNSFSSVQNLGGGTFNDNFRFVPGGVISGAIDGGGGIDRLDYSPMSTGVVVNLATKSATAIGVGFVNISDFVGASDNTNLLIGPNTDNTWRITTPNTGNINLQQFYYGFQNIQGGASSDTFVFVPGGIQSGNVSGGLGNNSIDYSQLNVGIGTNLQFSSSTAIGGKFSQIGSIIGSSATTDLLTGANDSSTWTINGSNAGTYQTSTYGIRFSGYENLLGGSNIDAFRFAPSGSMTGQVNGGLGQNTLDYSQTSDGITFNLQTRTATAIGSGFLNIQNLVGSSSTIPAKFDNLIGADVNSNWNITAGNSGNINGNFTFSSIENLYGGTANDLFNVAGGFESGTIQGGKGSNSLDYSAGTSGVIVNLQKLSATGIGGGFGQIQNFVGSNGPDAPNFDFLIGADTANTWQISGKNSGIINGSANFSGFENLTGGAAPDVFRFSPGAFLQGTVNGSPLNNGGDWLDYSALITPVTVNLAAGSGTAVGNIVNVQNVRGGDGVDTLAGNSQGNILVGGQSNDTITAGPNRSVVIGGAGSDTVTGNVNDDIVISSFTNYDSNLPALASILAEWQSPATFDQRVSHLRRGGGLNMNNVLIADVTVNNDVVPDVISGGGSFGRNWLWGQPAEIQGATSQDIIDTPVNNPPVLANGSTAVFTVGRPGVPINGVITVADVDNLTLSSATVQLTNNYIAGQDFLGFSPTSQTGNITGSFNSTTGILTLTSAFSTATLLQFQNALRNVTYTNSSSTPSTAPRTVIYQAFDGLSNSNTVSSTVLINFAPTIAGTSSITYSAFQAPTVINTNITVSDQNSATLAYATVSLSNIFFPLEDVLSFVGNASTGSLVGSYNSTTGVLTISAAGVPATVANYQAALQLVKYSNSSSTPTLLSRTATFQVNDGSVFSNTTTSTIRVV